MRTLFQLSSHWVLIQQKGARELSGVSFIRVKIPFTLPTKIYLVKAVVFLVVMYECESGTIKKAECRRVDDFELGCWRRLLRVPWTAGRSNQSILKENQPQIFIERTDAEAEAPILWPPDVKR